jgi:hypothetical protein
MKSTQKSKETKIDECGTKRWYNEQGELHREDGPAVKRTDGSKYWYLNGKLHREDAPAVEWENGYKEWWKNGNCHREDGPAVEYTDGAKLWYLNGVEYSEQEFHEKMKSTQNAKDNNFTAEQAREIQSAIRTQKAKAIVLNICKEILKRIENGSEDESYTANVKTESTAFQCKKLMIEKGFDVSINQDEDSEDGWWLIEVSWNQKNKVA